MYLVNIFYKFKSEKISNCGTVFLRLILKLRELERKKHRMPRTPKNKYALIWYISSCTKDVIQTSWLKGSKKTKGEFASVLWRDNGTGETKQHRVKIAEVGSKFLHVKIFTTLF